MMGWMDAHEYLLMERTLHDRLDEVERFSLERAFHSEAGDGGEPPRAAEPGAPILPRAVEPDRCREGPA
jgi:hypothetical protein